MSSASIEWSSHSRRPSLRRRLLLFLLVPILALLLIDAVVTYSVALAYANRVHDRGLADDALTLAAMLTTQPQHEKISSQARFLLEFDPDGHDYFAVRSQQHGLIAGKGQLDPVAHASLPDQPPRLYDMRLDHTDLRAATLAVTNPRANRDILQVTVAENLRARHRVARQILWLNIPLQLGLIAALLLLVWLGVRLGLRVLDPLTQRLGRRGHDLSPIDDGDVPAELLPLTRTIDDLFARLRDVMTVQERFIADAAHQLRTPLAGLRLQIDRAIEHVQDPRAAQALTHIERLTERATRTSVQLLTLTRAQTRPMKMAAVDLGAFVRALVGERVPDAVDKGIELALEATDEPTWIRGDTHALQDALNNLLDNALRYTPAGGCITVSLSVESPDWLRLQVDDDGPGVDTWLLARLGERFFRIADGQRDGTGLGLAIVKQIVEKHAGVLGFERSVLGGLGATIHLPRRPVNMTTPANVAYPEHNT